MTSLEWRFMFLACGCALALCLSGCHRSSGVSKDVVVRSEIEPKPARVGRAKITLTLADSSGKPLTRAQVTLEANMTHPGMTPVFAGAKEVGEGHYEGELNFSMGGDWIVSVHITSSQGQKFERELPLLNVQTG